MTVVSHEAGPDRRLAPAARAPRAGARARSPARSSSAPCAGCRCGSSLPDGT